MSLFNKLGRQVERFKQNVNEVAKDQTAYQCRACNTRFHTDRDTCPECGADEVVPVNTGDETDST